MQTAQFVRTGTTKVYLNDLKPVCATEPDLTDCVEIQTLNAGGYTMDEKCYLWKGDHWVYSEDESEIKTDITFDAGAGLWVYNYAGMDGVKLQSAGEVLTSDTSSELDNDSGAVIVANNYPVARSLNDYVPESATVADLTDCVELQMLNAGGYTIDEKCYLWKGDRWVYSEDESEIADPSKITFAPGEGLWVYNYAGEAGVYLRIAAPEL